ncbi:hypothetical protein E2C01_091002 [Portunus trituberculatus]|nr:hypothetical protein [Portunus trituberculatus]
MHDLVR